MIHSLTHSLTQKKPAECTNITEVRNEIDSIDKAIIQLLADRFEYVKEVVKYKDNTHDSIIATERRDAVLRCRRMWAEECGLSADVIEQMYDNLIKYFIAEEMKIAQA